MGPLSTIWNFANSIYKTKTFWRGAEKRFGARIWHVKINPELFSGFKSCYKDPRPNVDDQKLLEYYIGYTWLDIQPGDIFMDIAAQDCPFAFYIRDTVGCRVYRQDLYYLEEGIHGEDVGGDATQLPFPDGSLSKIVLFNSFEHFEGDKDILMIQEAQRVLRKGGKLCIVPLYLAGEYTVEEDSGWIDEKGEKHLWGLGARFSRTYNAVTFRKRILEQCPDFNYKIYHLDNWCKISPEIRMRYFVVFERK